MRESFESIAHRHCARREFLKLGIAAPSLLALPTVIKGQSKSMVDTKGPIASAVLMREAAQGLLTALGEDKTAMATFAFEDEQRFDWHFIPRARKGIPLKQLDPAQRLLATALLGASLSPAGLVRASTIMSLDDVLRQIETSAMAGRRDPELYYVSIFGNPDKGKPWGWRFEGHHISLNFTMAGDLRVATSPMFFGANPAEVREGPRKGLRALAREEDLARAFVRSLDDKQRAAAVVSESAPNDIISFNTRKAAPLTPAGIQANRLGAKQAEMLMGLIHHYASSVPPDVAALRMDRVRAAGAGNISFAWAGSLEPGQRHYYRIQASTFLIEYDNTQNNANHIHSVWRDFSGDFGLDALAEHYKDSHR
jgi:hypothetical protein